MWFYYVYDMVAGERYGENLDERHRVNKWWPIVQC